MNWKDILKAEIQIIPTATTADGDVNIDLEDDDCIRWVKKLIELFRELPELDTDYNNESKEYFKEDLLTEEMACEFKKLVNTGRVGPFGFLDDKLPMIALNDSSVLRSQNAYVSFDILFEGKGWTRFSYEDGKETGQESGPIMQLQLIFILTSPSGSVVSLERTGQLILDKQEIDSFERQIKKICRHCSWQQTGLNKFFTLLRSNYNNDNVEKTTGAMTISSPTAVKGKLFNISYGGRKRGKKRQSKEEDY